MLFLFGLGLALFIVFINAVTVLHMIRKPKEFYKSSRKRRLLLKLMQFAFLFGLIAFLISEFAEFFVGFVFLEDVAKYFAFALFFINGLYFFTRCLK
jgi:hypothetical protein